MSKEIIGICAPDPSGIPDILASFIHHGVTEEQLPGEALNMVIAGSDTTGTAMKTIMVHLINKPLVYMKLRREIDDGIAGGKISSPVKDSEARQLRYLQRSRKLFGPDADLFRPERWLEAEQHPEQLAKMTSAVDMVFYYGEWKCAGEGIARMELNKIFVEVGSGICCACHEGSQLMDSLASFPVRYLFVNSIRNPPTFENWVWLCLSSSLWT